MARHGPVWHDTDLYGAVRSFRQEGTMVEVARQIHSPFVLRSGGGGAALATRRRRAKKERGMWWWWWKGLAWSGPGRELKRGRGACRPSQGGGHIQPLFVTQRDQSKSLYSFSSSVQGRSGRRTHTERLCVRACRACSAAVVSCARVCACLYYAAVLLIMFIYVCVLWTDRQIIIIGVYKKVMLLI